MIDWVLLWILRYMSLLALVILSHEIGHLIACNYFKEDAELRWTLGKGFNVYTENPLPRNKLILSSWSGIILGFIPLILAFQTYGNSIFDIFILVHLSIMYIFIWIPDDLKILRGEYVHKKQE